MLKMHLARMKIVSIDNLAIATLTVDGMLLILLATEHLNRFKVIILPATQGNISFSLTNSHAEMFLVYY